MRKITIDHLKDAGACAGHLKRIRALVGSSVEVTEEWCIEHASKFDWDWAALNLLSDAAKAEYYRVFAPARAEGNRSGRSAWAEYERARAAAWAEYIQVCAAARAKYERAEYERARAAAWAEYDRASAPARAEYARVHKSARAEYYRSGAAAWARAYIQDGGMVI